VSSSLTGRAISFPFNNLCAKVVLTDRLLFWQMDRLGAIKLFFSLLLLIQLFASSEHHLESVENHALS
jgi:hypothetical protein